MGGNYLLDPLAFLVQAALGVFVLFLLLRFLLQFMRVDFYNPLSQFLVRVTQPLLAPVRRLVPGTPRVDGASLVVLVVAQMLAVALVAALRGASLGAVPLLMLSLAELVSLTVNVFLVSIIVQALLSWINPGVRNPLLVVLHGLNEPLLRPARRWLPPFSGIDLSPLLVLLGLQVVKMLLLPPLLAAATSLQ